MQRLVIAVLAVVILVHATPEQPPVLKKERVGVIKDAIISLLAELVTLNNDQIACSASFNALVIQEMYGMIEGNNALTERESLEKYRDQLKRSVMQAHDRIEKTIHEKNSLEKIKQVAKNK